jgi:hypothetical protein
MSRDMFKTGQFSVIENVILLVCFRIRESREYNVSWQKELASGDAVVKVPDCLHHRFAVLLLARRSRCRR